MAIGQGSEQCEVRAVDAVTSHNMVMSVNSDLKAVESLVVAVGSDSHAAARCDSEVAASSGTDEAAGHDSEVALDSNLDAVVACNSHAAVSRDLDAAAGSYLDKAVGCNSAEACCDWKAIDGCA